ncbi:MAG: penicillin-binding protein 2 [Candidatus Methylacidiphilales bacterium]|nr:penicillin-binding protein 2 [Candidatus Methylacidiphilales bacterium]
MLLTTSNVRPGSRLQTLGLGVVCAVAVLIFQLHQVQVKEGRRYADELRNQTTVPVVLSPARGSILDRNGVGLAENRASYDIDVYLRELVGNYLRANKGHVPKTQLPWNKRYVADVDLILRASTDDVLQSIGLTPQFTRRDILRHFDQQPNIPFRLASGLDYAALARFAEHSVNVPGIQETARPVRTYNFGALAPHILGYLGQVEEATEEDFVPESVGKEGVEKTLDEFLQGKPGGKILRKNNLGYILGVEAIQQPTIGANVYLSIDVRVQHIAEQAMRRVGRGACVILDPNNGDILAMVSVPNYDPNVFVPKVSADDWKKLTRDSTRPMLNRALSGYAAGSTFKTIVGMAALKNEKIQFTPNTVINCGAAFWWVNRWWPDWPGNPGEGAINIKTALQWSTNTFFYQLALRTKAESIADMARTAGLGERLLVDEKGEALISGESPGVVPSPEWMDAREERQIAAWKERKKKDPTFKVPRTWREKWSDGHTLNMSIGQGFVEATPLQMATMIAAVANGGKVYQPRLVRAVTRNHSDGVELVKEYPVRVRSELGVPTAKLTGMKEGLLACAQSGTGKKANVGPDFQVGGKTGTAQFTTSIGGRVVKDNRAWFTGFVPFESPRYAIAIVVEGGTSGGGTAGPIVSEIFHRIHAMENGESYDLVYLTPAIGHYAGVTGPAYVPPAESAADSNPASATPVDVPPPVDFSAPAEAIDEMAEPSGASRQVQEMLNRRRR